MLKQKMKSVFVAVVIFLLALLISIFNPLGTNTITEEMKIIFSFIGVLFAILSGFFIASLWDRFTKIRTLISSESASLENLYKFVEIVDKKLSAEIAGLIDRYIIKGFEYGMHEYQEKLSEEYFALYKPLDVLKNKGGDVPFTRVLNLFDQFTKTRKEILSRGKDKIGAYHWTVLFLLSFLLIGFWTYIQFSGVFGIITGTVFIFAIIAVLVIIYDLNNLTWGSEQMGTEIYERVYDVIKLPRYYPEEILNRINIPKGIKEYRIGILVDPETHKREIKKVTRR